ncbi:MAG: DUF5723 family protein [Candidatus Cloacimonadaceae bacterium]|nr:DUF5723 family protein [Candidatus Cloacimonadaceae bacterium]
MKKYLLAMTLTAMVILLGALPTNKSLGYGESYMMRARGVEALYWNPANLSSKYGDLIIPAGNSSFSIMNNSLDLSTYNDFVSLDYLTDADKERFLSKIDRRLTVDAEGHAILFGMTRGSMAYSAGMHYYTRAAISKKYLTLLFYGNEEEEYTFHKNNNNVSGIAFMDLTAGVGDIIIKFDDTKIPKIRFGYSGSILIGAADVSTKDYTGFFSSNLDGVSAVQDITLKSGIGGIGFKGMVGVSSEPLPNLQLGLTLDNLLGFIKWNIKTANLNYQVVVDSVYVSNLSEDFYTESNTSTGTSSYSTSLPPELRFGSLYKYRNASVSLDWIQGFSNSLLTSKRGRLASSVEYLPVPYLPLSMGVATGNSEYPWRASYGIGFRNRVMEFGIGFQCFESLIPTYSTKGISLSSHISFRI